MLAALRHHVLPVVSLSREDAIVVVGDGSRPRTAALLALTVRGERHEAPMVYSIDPLLHYDSASGRSFPSRASCATEAHVERWRALRGLVMVRDRVQSIRITGHRKAVLVLMHSHVSVADAVACVDGATIAAIVAVPCCNWEPLQAAFDGRAADVEYKDSSLLSDHNLVRVWCASTSAASSDVATPAASQVEAPFPASPHAVQKQEAADGARHAVAALVEQRLWGPQRNVRVVASSAAVATRYAADGDDTDGSISPCVVGVVGGRRVCASVTFFDLYPLGSLERCDHAALGVAHDIPDLCDRVTRLPVSGPRSCDQPSSVLVDASPDCADYLEDGASALWAAVDSHAQVARFVGRSQTLSVVDRGAGRARGKDDAPVQRPARQRNAVEELLRSSSCSSDRMQVVLPTLASGATRLRDVRAGDAVLLRLARQRLNGSSTVPFICDGIVLFSAAAEEVARRVVARRL